MTKGQSDKGTRVKTHKDLEVWKNSLQLVIDLYKITDSFPRTEVFGLSSQIRRAAVSIPSNIAEGAARKSSKEFTQFLHIANGSLAELETQLIIALRLAFISEDTFITINNKLNIIRSQLTGLINYRKNNK